MGNNDSKVSTTEHGQAKRIDATDEGQSQADGGHSKQNRRRRSSSIVNEEYKTRKKAQLRAKSFLRREKKDGHLEELQTSSDTDGSIGEDGSVETMIAELQAYVQLLSKKCSALESQNILVSVQQLDWMARSISWLLVVLTWYFYWQWLSIVIARMPLQKLFERFYALEFNTTANAEDYQKTAACVELLIKVILWTIPYFYNRYTHGSFHRRLEVFSVAFIVIGRIRLCRWREQNFVQPDADIDDPIKSFGEACTDDGIWEANYEISARFLYLSIKRLRGLWTKSAQYMSSRADFMPLAYIRELSKLQDQTVATPWEDIEYLLASKLRRDLVHVDTTPIASASIGQVHVAVIRHQGHEQKVVIKVQHPHARTLMLDDFRSLMIICRIVGWLEPEYAFMGILMREWALEARKELDFTNEMYHLMQAQEALQGMFPISTGVCFTQNNSPFRAEIPTPFPEYSNQKVLVMEYCEGCRVDNFAQLERWKLDTSEIMDALSQTFAHMMYCSTIFNGDPHPGNLFCRPGISLGNEHSSNGLTLVLLDWGLAKQLPEEKRLGFCQMVYAAATLDYGLLMDSYKTIGLKMKREDAGQSMEDMRFFLRDMAPRSQARQKIKSKIHQGQELAKKNKEKVPMESKAYPGELFFFIRVTELLHGLGSKLKIDMKYLDTIRPYAERGLRNSIDRHVTVPKNLSATTIANRPLQESLEKTLKDLETEGNLVGAQICVLNAQGETEADVVFGTLGGFKDHVSMSQNTLVLGYSCTKAITATLAHIMIEENFLSLDEPICERVWKAFCPTQEVPAGLARSLELSPIEVQKRWEWKRQITLRHILNHAAGLWTAFPPRLTIKSLSSCEMCCAAFEYNPNNRAETILPSRMPGEKSEYHFLSFGWLVAGTLRGAFAAKHGLSEISYEQVYESILYPKLSKRVKDFGFRPLGAKVSENFTLANTVTSDVRASEIMQKQREKELDGDSKATLDQSAADVMKTFKGVEFLLDPRIWNSQDALSANVPAAGGRFSAAALAHFYHELGNLNLLLKSQVVETIFESSSLETSISAMQGITKIASDDTTNHRTKLSLGFQLIQTERDGPEVYSGIGHAGIGGSIGFWHKPTGLAIGVMLNKADAGEEVTMRILRTIGHHYRI